MEIKPISPAIQQLIVRDLGAYGGLRSGVDKYFYLLNAVYNLQSYLIVNYGKAFFDEEMKKQLAEIGEYSSFKSWADLDKKLTELRPQLNEIKMLYDDIGDRERNKGKITEKEIRYKKLARKISPYQLELFLAFQILAKVSGVQRITIPKQAFKTPEQQRFQKTPFDKNKPDSGGKVREDE